MRRSADPLRELARLVRLPDQQCHNIGLHLRTHARELGPALGLDQELLQAMSDQPDHLLAPKIEQRLRALKEQRAVQQAVADNARAHAAAIQLAASARWNCAGVFLDGDVLLGALLADPSMKYIAFCLPGHEVAIERGTIAATSKTLAHRRDLLCFIDPAGLHFRWHDGRGGLNWFPQIVRAEDRPRVLRVELNKPAPAPMPARVRRPAWSWDALAGHPLSP